MRPGRSRMQDSGRFGLAYWTGLDRGGAGPIEARAWAAADLELLIQAHQPDEAGDCAACKAVDDIATYPCMPRLICEQAAIALQRRRGRGGGTVYERRR